MEAWHERKGGVAGTEGGRQQNMVKKGAA